MDVLKCYEENQKHSFKILMSLYEGTYTKLILSAVCFAIKHTPTWILPITTANIINIATNPVEHNVYEIYTNIAILNNLKKGRTTFIVAHRFSTIRDADRIAIIKAGKCVKIGTYDELMKQKNEFYQLKKLQM